MLSNQYPRRSTFPSLPHASTPINFHPRIFPMHQPPPPFTHISSHCPPVPHYSRFFAFWGVGGEGGGVIPLFRCPSTYFVPCLLLSSWHLPLLLCACLLSFVASAFYHYITRFPEGPTIVPSAHHSVVIRP